MALEEVEWRTKSRLKKLLRGTKRDALRDLKFVYKLDSIYAAGDIQLEQLLTELPTDVLFVDTLLAATKCVKQSRDLLRTDYADVDFFSSSRISTK